MSIRNTGPMGRSICAAALGAAAALIAIVAGVPGRGEFLVAAWAGGVLAVLVAPGWRGFLAYIVGITVGGVVADLSDGSYGLVVLVVAVLVAPGAHGALVGTLGRRIREFGLRGAFRDPRAISGAVLVVCLALAFAWFAAEFARNPP